MVPTSLHSCFRIVGLALACAGVGHAGATTPEIKSAGSFLGTVAPEWKALQVEVQSEESAFAHLAVALECNPSTKRVFFDALLLRMITKSSETPESDIYALGTKVEIPYPGTDWQRWLGKLPVKVGVNGGARSADFPYFAPTRLSSAGAVSVAGYVVKLNPGEMRPRVVPLLRGSKSEIAREIAGQIRRSLDGGEGSLPAAASFSLVTTGGLPVVLTFDLRELEQSILGALKKSCN